MLSILNRYSHGYVAIPVIHACKKQGLFQALQLSKRMPFADLVKQLHANSGSLQVALRMLESLNWVSRNHNDEYCLTPKSEVQEKIPQDIMELMSFPIPNYLDKNQKKYSLKKWVRMSSQHWNISDPLVSDFLDGMLVIPLLLALKEKAVLSGSQNQRVSLFSTLTPSVRKEITELFMNQGWLQTKGSNGLTETGRFITERIFITATVASYAPMLMNLSKVIFGDCQSVFKRDLFNHEQHVNRSLNIIGSGFQHEKYFSDLEEIILSIFNREPYSQQPKYIADTGCGDGTLLKKIYEIIKNKSLRGKVLNDYPIKLVGVDFNKEALDETTKRLKGIDHIILKGDIGNPGQMIEDLKTIGIQDTENILHVRSFLDHDRPYIPPVDTVAESARSHSVSNTVYMDKGGNSIAAASVIQSLVEHFKRWSPVVGKHGLIILEVHCLGSKIVQQFIDKCESLHFDAYHRFSQQLLVEADLFLMTAAEAGLFPKNSFRRYPKTFPFCRITLIHFEKQIYCVRQARSEDLTTLLEFENAIFLASPSASRNELRQRLEQYSQGQCVIEVKGEIVAVIYTQRVSIEAKDSERYVNTIATWQHTTNGNLVELLCLRCRFDKYGEFANRLLDFVEDWSGLINGVEKVIVNPCCYDRHSLNNKNARNELPEQINSHIRQYLETVSPDADRDSIFPERELEAFGVRWLLHKIQMAGFLCEPSSIVSITSLIRKMGILSKYNDLFHSLLDIFERYHFLELDGDELVLSHDIKSYSLKDIQVECDQFKSNFLKQWPNFKPFMDLMFVCLKDYLAVLIGDKAATDVIFPSGSMDLFLPIFFGNEVADFYNEIIAEVICKKVELQLQYDPDNKINLLEIGAGTGGTTRRVLQKLNAFAPRVNFYYTDISSSFTRHGAQMFSEEYPWVVFKRLDIEKDLKAQGYTTSSFDIVYASNVLHDTEYILNTLWQVRNLLKPGGLLALNEYTLMKDLLLFTGGLLHGWWLFKDPENRLSHSCLLSTEQWRKAIRNSGFSEFQAYKLPYIENDEDIRQAVMTCHLGVSEPQSETIQVTNMADSLVKLPLSSRTLAEKGPIDVVWNDAYYSLVRECLQQIVGDDRIEMFSADVPFMEAGLDSIEMLEFRSALEQNFSINLDATFLFQHNTVTEVVHVMEASSTDSIHRIEEEPVKTPAVSGLVSIDDSSTADKTTSKSNDLNQGDRLRDIAVVGMALRFPGNCETMTDYWNLLVRGEDAIISLPKGRFDWPNDLDIDGEKKYLLQGGFLNSIDQFDASFFRISPADAELMDPQQRMLLELSWCVLEDAGYCASELRGSNTGVYVGACHFDYGHLQELRNSIVKPQLSTGTSGSILANRLSYFYDFHGPSQMVDTACSSSLVALHQAVQGIRSGECNLALVGGCNIICSPTNSIAYDQAGMLSKTGKSYTFDTRADGYVRGEGGAIILLKSLDDAEIDNNTIYGIIKGTAVKHGGQASSLTAPNPATQYESIQYALKDAKVPVDTIGYIETHGTATPLGDPIEIKGLIQAFNVLGVSSNANCKLGSVKTNIGHLEGAAGIAGLIKTLLCFVHKTIPQNVNFEELNAEIQLPPPFEIAKNTQHWASLKNPEGKDLPRRAGVSSFGFGGTNAHAVLEEYNQHPPVNSTSPRPLLFMLSAKNMDRLKAYAQKLFCYLDTQDDKTNRNGKTIFSLESFVYSLQRRQAMNERIAFIVASFSELKEKLRSLAQGAPIAGSYQSSIKEGQGNADFVNSNEDMDKVFKTWLLEEKAQEVAKLWVKGVPVKNWDLFYKNVPDRISLPTYPFARERYWVQETGFRVQMSGVSKTNLQSKIINHNSTQLHPLVHENTSTLKEQRFSSTFTGEELFLRDHHVKGEKVLPGVAYLEMAQEAVKQASGEVFNDSQSIELKNVVWASPIKVSEPQKVHIGLFPEENGEIAYEIYTENLNPKEDALVHSQGVALLTTFDKPPSLNLADLQKKLNQNSLSPQECYDAFKTIGIDYGPACHGFEKVYVGDNEVLAKLTLPSSVSETKDQFTLHPSLLDSALQASIGLILVNCEPGTVNLELFLPFALESLEIMDRCPELMWAWLRCTDGPLTLPGTGAAASDGVKKLDIDLCDDAGKVCVKMRGFSFENKQSNLEYILHKTGKKWLSFIEEWVLLPLKTETELWTQKIEAKKDHDILVISGEMNDYASMKNICQRLAQLSKNDEKLWNVTHLCIQGETKCRIEESDMKPYITESASPQTIFLFLPKITGRPSANNGSALRELELIYTCIQSIMHGAAAKQIQFYCCYQDRQLERSLYREGLVGLLKSANLESMNHCYRSISSDDQLISDGQVALRLIQEWLGDETTTFNAAKVPIVRYTKGDRFELQLRETTEYQAFDQSVLFREGGTYLMVGALGAVGELICQELGRQYHAQLVIFSRRSENTVKESLMSIEAAGASVIYRSVDILDRKSLKKEMKSLKKGVGEIL